MLDDFTPWTSERADELWDAARATAQAILDHATVLTELSGGGDRMAIIAADAALQSALVTYSDAQFAYCGSPGPLGPVRFSGDSDDELPAPMPANGIAVFQRRDYAVVDEDAVLAAGRAAYGRAWPDDSAEDAVADVSHLGRALYQVAHDAGSWRALDEIDGLVIAGGMTIVAQVDEVLGSDPDHWPDDLFAVDPEQALYTESDVYLDEQPG